MLDGIFCRDSCPTSGLSCTREGFQRLFTAQSQWSDQKALRKRPNEIQYSLGTPQEGDDVWIPCEWIVQFNLEYFKFGTLTIDGIFKIDPNIPSVTIEANNIFIRSGEFIAGTDTLPYTNQLTIRLYGTRDGKYIFLDD